MAILITVETGAGVADANSFATVAEARTYATNRGVVLASDGGAGDDLVAIMLIKAMDYLWTLPFVGYVVLEPQTTPFPRRLMYVNPEAPKEEYSRTVVPREVKEAQLALVMQIKAGVDILPTNGSSAFIKREKIGPIETEYSEAVNTYIWPSMPKVDALLARFLQSAGFSLRTVRA